MKVGYDGRDLHHHFDDIVSCEVALLHELIKQLEVVREKLPEIYDSGTTLNIWLERESSTPG